ncbi:MAG: hypothetical protein JXA42_13680, partial [Anaerolineales bacterium]|nr:hypothetical protein [Anaerolineales bacterium]
MTKREFTVAGEYHYNRTGPVRWIISHTVRYPVYPIAMILAAILNNAFYSYIQVYIGRAFDLITSAGWEIQALLVVALGAMGSAAGQSVTGLIRNYAIEFTAQRVERDS